MKLTYLEKDAMRQVLLTFESCVEFDERNQNYVDGGNFTLAMDKKTFDYFQSGLKKFRKYTLADVRAFKKRQLTCTHEYSILDGNKMCLKCGLTNTELTITL